ncbi:MAG TPA: cytidylate kinase-like family protein, partial [Thermoanaerobaculia bacterium]|nr:cytidylate kinase-like family protein [Thermoanaerobaculia bacterium]
MLITISRQFAAGGSQVARHVAESLGWRLIDDELVDRVAERAGVSREEVAALEERAPSFIERLARLTALELPELFLPTADAMQEFGEGHLVKITRALVEEIAAEGRCVVVGRASAAVLARTANTLHVRVVAPLPMRVRIATERLGLDPAEAPRIVEERDANRARYHREYYDRDWNDPVNYDLVLNTGRLGFEGAARVIE